MAKDVNAVHDLLSGCLERFDMAPNFDKGEVDHWLLHKGGCFHLCRRGN